MQIDGQAEGLVDLKWNDPLCPIEAMPPPRSKTLSLCSLMVVIKPLHGRIHI